MNDRPGPALGKSSPRDVAALVAAVRKTLREKNLTLYRAARLTRARHPRDPDYHLRPNFYFQLRSGLSPTLYQLVALSEVTGHSLGNWLRLFDFPVESIPRLQATLDRPRTGLIEHALVDGEATLPAYRYREEDRDFSIAPLSQVLGVSGSESVASLVESGRRDFVYAKLGKRDALAFPELLPGSVVRADPRLVAAHLPKAVGAVSRHYFLLEHSRGLCCGRLRLAADNRVAFIAKEPAFAGLEFELGSEARILGVLDFEIRFRPAGRGRGNSGASTAKVASDLAESSKPQPLELRAITRKAGEFLRNARFRAGLSFRCASKLSRKIAEELGDHRYFASPGTLSDYEAGDRAPRHIHKVFTLAILYCVRFEDLLRSFGIVLEETPKRTFPEGSLGANERPSPNNGNVHEDKHFFRRIVKRFGDLPLFFPEALPSLSGLTRLSLRDVYEVRGPGEPLHPSLAGARFLVINRWSKQPRFHARMAVWKLPLYILRTREGSFLAGAAAAERGRLLLHVYPATPARAAPLRRTVDAEVVGRIVGIARSLVSPP